MKGLTGLSARPERARFSATSLAISGTIWLILVADRRTSALTFLTSPALMSSSASAAPRSHVSRCSVVIVTGATRTSIVASSSMSTEVGADDPPEGGCGGLFVRSFMSADSENAGVQNPSGPSLLPIDELVVLLAVLSPELLKLHGELSRRPSIDHLPAFAAD